MIEGLLLVDKPEGPTSHDIVARVRRLTRQRRVGHAGTLDPMASGLLPLVLGRATRLVRFLPDSPKIYAGSLRLGLTTTTDDITGEPLVTHDGDPPGTERVLEAARRLHGTLLQRPPAVSARKVGGQRLYRLARMGRDVDAPARRVQVFRFDLTPGQQPGDWHFEAEVSGGTYVRSLARDLGAALACGGTLTRLRRLSIGVMNVAGAVRGAHLGELDGKALAVAVTPLEAMPLLPPAVALKDPGAVRGFRSGRTVPAPRDPAARGLCRVLDPSGNLLGVAEASAGGLQPKVVLPPPTG